MKINKIVIGGFTLLLSISACDNLNYKEYTSQNEDYMKVTYERVTGLLNNVYTKLDTDFGNNYSGGMLASACDEADYAYANNSVCDFTNGNWSPTNALSVLGPTAMKPFKYVMNTWLTTRD